MKAKFNISLFWKLLMLCGGLIFIAAITQNILLRFLISSDAMRKLYLQEWQLTIMQEQFQHDFSELRVANIEDLPPSFISKSFSDYIIDEGYLIHEGTKPFLLLHIDNLAVVNLNGDLIGQLGEQHFKKGNLFTQLNLAAREDLVEALIGKDPFGSSQRKSYPGITVAISLTDINGAIVGALIIDQRRELSDNLTGLAFGFMAVAKGVVGYFINLIFACFFFALVMAFYLNRRIKKITQGVQQWQKGDFSERITDKASDELAHCSHKLNDMADSLQQALVKEAQIAALQERQHLAIELHDTVKQRLFATSLKVALCEKIMFKEPIQAQTLLDEISEQCQQAFVELQHTIDALRLNETKSWSQLNAFFVDWQTKHAINIEYCQSEHWQPMDKHIPLLWRVIVEALQNIVKHAKATKVNIEISHNEKSLQVLIQDNGIGCGQNPVLGQGLSLLATSLNSFGGSLQLARCSIHKECESSGTELRIQLPMLDVYILKRDELAQKNEH
jgi:NarL family two-component system sensor histidine kinase LiaS